MATGWKDLESLVDGTFITIVVNGQSQRVKFGDLVRQYVGAREREAAADGDYTPSSEWLKDENIRLKNELRDLRYEHRQLQTLQRATRDEVDEKVAQLERYTRDPKARSERERDLLLQLGQMQTELHEAQQKARGLTNQLEAYNTLPYAARQELKDRAAKLAALGAEVERREQQADDYYKRLLADTNSPKRKSTKAERVAKTVATLADELLTEEEDHG